MNLRMAKITLLEKNFLTILDLMKDTLLLFILGVIVAALLIGGFLSAIKKSFTTGPVVNQDSFHKKEDLQKQRMDEIREQQKRLMENQKQRIRDLSR